MSKKNNWVTVSGLAEIADDAIKYIPHKSDLTMTLGTLDMCTVKSDCLFNEGEVSFDVKITSVETGVQLVLCWGNPLYVSFNVGNFAFGLRSYNQNQSQSQNFNNSIAETGSKESLELNKTYNIKVIVKASFARLYIDGVEILSLIHNTYKAPLSFNFFGNGEAIVSNVKVVDYKPRVFVVMQFTEQFNDLYNSVIKPICEQKGLEPVRADDFYTNGLIIHDIVQSIYDSSVIIADITPNNPNVYYEVGFAHASNKHVVLLCDKEREKLPFDLSGFRTIFYTNSISGKDEVEHNLRKHLEKIFPID
ncbi:hypothetical protein MA794_004501 [Vibrio vulnificus]|nr:hypothetical protein [Vibrio vulnificus]